MSNPENHKWDIVLQALPNEVLQYVNSKSNEILLQRYEQEQKEYSRYTCGLATALLLLGERQDKHTKRFYYLYYKNAQAAIMTSVNLSRRSTKETIHE